MNDIPGHLKFELGGASPNLMRPRSLIGVQHGSMIKNTVTWDDMNSYVPFILSPTPDRRLFTLFCMVVIPEGTALSCYV